MDDVEQPEAAAQDAATPIDANVGAEFTVTLDANHSTGYSWGLLSPLDPTLVELVKSDYETNPHPPGMVGAPGHETWTFRAAGPGSTTITLIYRRPWEQDADPADSKTFEVEIIQS